MNKPHEVLGPTAAVLFIFYRTQWDYIVHEQDLLKKNLRIPALNVIIIAEVIVVTVALKTGRHGRLFDRCSLFFNKPLRNASFLQRVPVGLLGQSPSIFLPIKNRRLFARLRSQYDRDRLVPRTCFSCSNRKGRSLTRVFISCSSLLYSLIRCWSAILHVTAVWSLLLSFYCVVKAVMLQKIYALTLPVLTYVSWVFL